MCKKWWFYALLIRCVFEWHNMTSHISCVLLHLEKWSGCSKPTILAENAVVNWQMSRVPQESQGHKAVVEVLAFKSQLHAQPWHIVSMHSFQFHGTFLLVLPVDFVLPSSPLFVNTAQIYVLRLSPVFPNPTCTVWFPGGFHGRTWACTSASCVRSHPDARLLNNTKAVTGHFATAPMFERYLGYSKTRFRLQSAFFAGFREQLAGGRYLNKGLLLLWVASGGSCCCCCVWLAWQQGPNQGFVLFSCGGQTIQSCILSIINCGSTFFSYNLLRSRIEAERAEPVPPSLSFHILYLEFKNLKQGKHSSEGFFLPRSDHVDFNRETSVSVCAKMKISSFSR